MPRLAAEGVAWQRVAHPPPSSGPAPAPSTDPLVGTVLADRYRMTKRIGIGGMGSVYLAEHIALRRPVAIKLLKPEHHKDPDLVERFFREARATAAIRHFRRLAGTNL